MIVTRRVMGALALLLTVQMFAEIATIAPIIEATLIENNKKEVESDVLTREGGITRSAVKNITFLKSFQPNSMNRLKNALSDNNNAPFIIVDAFVCQPYFLLETCYDITTTLQVHASEGHLCIPQDLRAFIGNQGTLPYMYIAKIVFIMDGITYNLCYRNGFWDSPVTKHESQFADMVTTCSPYICFS